MSQIFPIRSIESRRPYGGETLYEAAERVFALPPYEVMLEQDRVAVQEFLRRWPEDSVFGGPLVYFFAPVDRGGVVITESSRRRVFVHTDGRVTIEFGRPSYVAAAKLLRELYAIVEEDGDPSCLLNIDVWSEHEGIVLASDRERLEPAIEEVFQEAFAQ